MATDTTAGWSLPSPVVVAVGAVVVAVPEVEAVEVVDEPVGAGSSSVAGRGGVSNSAAIVAITLSSAIAC